MAYSLSDFRRTPIYVYVIYNKSVRFRSLHLIVRGFWTTLIIQIYARKTHADT